MRRLFALAVLALLPPVVEGRPLDEAGAGEKPYWWDWTTIVPGKIGLGGGDLRPDEAEYVASQGFRAVLNLRVEHEDPVDALRDLDMTYLRVPLGDAEHDTLDPDELDAALAFIDGQLDAGRPVYLHCIAGWHRSAAIAAAWLMKEEGLGADEAWARLEELRPTVEPRWIDGLYAYEARDGRPKLHVDVHVGEPGRAAGEEVVLTAVVTHAGRPFAGANVSLASEYDGVRSKATTGADGVASMRFTFDGSKYQYVNARATAPGFVPGYDRAVLYGESVRVPPGPFELTVDAPPGPHAPGAEVVVRLRATGEDGEWRNPRVALSDGEATLWRSYLGRDGAANATIRAPSAPGTHVLAVRATSPYAATQTFELDVEVEGPPGKPAGDDGPRVDPAVALAPNNAPGVPASVSLAAILAIAVALRCARARRSPPA